MRPLIDVLAEEAYAAYGAVTDFKNYQGLPMPQWHELPEKIREAWKAATQHVWNRARDMSAAEDESDEK